MEKVTKNPRPSPNRQSVSSIVERRVIKSTLCVASLTGSLVSKDLAYSRVIPCKYKRDDWDRQVDLWTHTREDMDKKVRLCCDSNKDV